MILRLHLIPPNAATMTSEQKQCATACRECFLDGREFCRL